MSEAVFRVFLTYRVSIFSSYHRGKLLWYYSHICFRDDISDWIFGDIPLPWYRAENSRNSYAFLCGV